jgi:hypothetical protein
MPHWLRVLAMNHISLSRRCFPLLVVLLLAAHASAGRKEKLLHVFEGGSDGQNPAGGVVFDKQGNLYGATTYGGLSACAIGGQCGIVFELSPPVRKGDPWTETVIYEFQGQGDNDGGVPAGGLIIDGLGNLYGTTAYGGSGGCVVLGLRAGCGTVYELSPPDRTDALWAETILYSFQGGDDGDFPSGDLTFDSRGTLYGATQFGGGKGNACDVFYGGNCGTAFKLSPPKQKGGAWSEQVLHSFAGIVNGNQTGDGANPNGGLVLNGKGTIYGTTYIGGYNCAHHSNQGCGTVFELKPPIGKNGVWIEKQIHVFRNGADGGTPNGGLVLDTKGALYGGADGGSKGGGVIFRLAVTGCGAWKETSIYKFYSNTYGFSPGVSHFDSHHNLYGTTQYFPDAYSGSVFRLRPPTQTVEHWTLTFLHKFNFLFGDGIAPYPQLTTDDAGNLYGATESGGDAQACYPGGCGVVFEVSP